MWNFKVGDTDLSWSCNKLEAISKQYADRKIIPKCLSLYKLWYANEFLALGKK